MQSSTSLILNKDELKQLSKQFSKDDIDFISKVIELLVNHETGCEADVVPIVENNKLMLFLEFPEFEAKIVGEISKNKGKIIISLHSDEKDNKDKKIACDNKSCDCVANEIRNYMESIEPDYGDTETEYKKAANSSCRDVYVTQTFINTLKDNIKTNQDIDRVYTEIALRYMTFDDGQVEQWLDNKHGVPIPCENGKMIYRKRSPKGSNVAKINRYLVCKGNQLNTRTDVKYNDIILLAYMGEDKHRASDYIPYANEMALKLTSLEFNEKLIGTSVSDVSNSDEMIYRIAPPRTDVRDKKYNLNDNRKRIPILDAYQYTQLSNNIIVHPPCLVYGSAGTGKTLLSEELYEKMVRENPQAHILYLTYMPRLKNQVVKDLEMRNLPANEGEIMTIDELIQKISSKDYKTREDFNEWANEYIYKNNVKYKNISEDKNLAIDVIYIFFRTYSDTNAMVYKNTFFEKIANEKGIPDEAKEVIWDVCTHYESYLHANNKYSDNSIVKRLPGLCKDKYDCIIIDEVQDLTRTQVESIIDLLSDKGKFKNHNFYAFGDDNQTINPTLMRLSNVDEILHVKLKKENKEPIILKESYRSTEYLIKYINYINKCRIKVIAKDKGYNDDDQVSKVGSISGNESCMPIFVNDEKILHKCMEDRDIFLNNNVKIIVPGKNESNHLIEKYGWLEGNNKRNGKSDSKSKIVTTEEKNIYTIEETKGGEWDIIILYDFFSSQQKIWKFFVELMENPESKSLKSTVHRMYFSRFYVGLTRASKKVIIAESQELDPQIKKYFIPKSINDNGHETKMFSEVKDYSEFRNFFADDYTHDTWFEKAVEMYELSDFEMASDFIIKAQKSLENSVKSNDEDLLKEYMQLQDKYSAWQKIINLDLGKESSNNVIEYALTYGDESLLKLVYEKLNQTEKLKLILRDRSANPDDEIKQYETIMNDYDLSDAEINYFSLEAIKAYRSIINEKIKEW